MRVVACLIGDPSLDDRQVLSRWEESKFAVNRDQSLDSTHLSSRVTLAEVHDLLGVSGRQLRVRRDEGTL